MSAGAPKIDTHAAGSSGGSLGNAAAGGGSAYRQVILPLAYEGLIKRYFARDEDNQN